MFQYSANEKKCATCVYWMGDRQVQNSTTGCFVDNQGVKGKCTCSRSSQSNVSGDGPQSNYVCSNWSKWPAIK